MIVGITASRLVARRTVVVVPGTLPIAGSNVAVAYLPGSGDFSVAITPGAIPVTGSVVTGSVGIHEPALTPGAIPVGGSSVSPVRGYEVDAVTAGALPIVGSSVVPAVAQTTTWSTTDKTAGITLSNGNLTATNTTGANQVVYATRSHSSGKRVFAFDPTVISGSTSYQVGILRNAIGAPSFGITHAAFNSVIRYVTTSTALTVAASYTSAASEVMIAVDIDNFLFWVRVGAGSWNNNNPAGADPATGTGGRDFTAAGAGSYFPAFMSNNTTCELILNVGNTAFTNAIPSGFSAWG